MGVQFTFDFDRALAAMVYIASSPLVTNLDTYKMCKLVFLSDKLHIVRYGRPITGDSLRAMKYGPVPSAVYDILDAYATGHENERVRNVVEHLSMSKRPSHRFPVFDVAQTVDYEYFLSSSDICALDEVISAHGDKNFGNLYDLTHAMPAYKNAWNNPDRCSQNPLMSFEDLFTDDAEANEYAKEEMIEDYELRAALHAA